jgi:type IV secretion system protein TrbI
MSALSNRKSADNGDMPELFAQLPSSPSPGHGSARQRTSRQDAANDDRKTGDPPDLFADEPAKLDPDTLELRASPQSVKRLSPRAIILLCAIALSALAGITIAALRPPKLKPADKTTELYESNLKPKPAELEELPKTYADWLEQIRQGKTPGAAPEIPQLGPPLPGDIGHTYAVQNGLAVQPASSGASAAQYNAAQQQRAEHMRQIEQARGSGLFFTGKSGSATPASAPSENADVMNILSRLGSPPVNAINVSPEKSIANDIGENRNTLLRGPDTRDDDTLNPHALTPLISPYTVLAGGLIPAALIGDMNSDLPGMIQAQVTENVYDSVSGKFLLIPQGSKLIGHYDARILFGQERALVIWTRLILPDGSSMILEQFSGTDARGQSGLSDKVDWHTGKLVKGVILSSLLGVGSELSFGSSNDDSLRSLARAIQNSGNSAGQEIVRRILEVKPTIRIRGGTKLNVLVSSDLLLKPWEQSK